MQALFDCLVRQVPREAPDLPVGEGRHAGKAVSRLSGLEGKAVSQPGGEGHGGVSVGLVSGAAAVGQVGEALEVATEGRMPGELLSEPANLL